MTVAWLNRAGLILQFLALFLVTPDIIGHERFGSAQAHSQTFWTRHRVAVLLIALTFGTAALSFTVKRALAVFPILIVAITALWWFLARQNRSFFGVGAFLFTVGFICLLWGTFLPA